MVATKLKPDEEEAVSSFQSNKGYGDLDIQTALTSDRRDAEGSMRDTAVKRTRVASNPKCQEPRNPFPH